MAAVRRNMRKVAELTVGLVFAAAGIVGWLSPTATGSEDSAASTPATGVTINQTGDTDVWLGVTKTLSGTFDNPNAWPVRVTTVTATLGTVTKSTDAPEGTCDATDFAITNSTVAVDQDVAPGSHKGSWSGPVLVLVDKKADQDACLGATVTVNYTSV